MDTDSSASAAALDPDLLAAVRAFFPQAARATGLPEHPDLARVETPDGPRRVRRWPEETPERDVAFSHRVTALARGAGLSVVPTVVGLPASDGTFFRHAGRLYDARAWLAGSPPARSEIFWPAPGDRIDLPAALPDTVFRAVVVAAATLHGATTDLAREPDVPSAPLSMLPGAVQQAQRQHFAALRARAPREPAIQRWLATGERLIANAAPLVIRAAEDPAVAVTAVHLSLWPAHILIEDGALSGLIGWERAAVGSPLLDLAQAILRLRGWTDEIVETAIGVYSEARPLLPTERRLLPAVAALDAVAATGRLLEQTFAGGRTDRPPAPLRAAIDVMLRSMANIDRTLTMPEKPRRRVWRHAPAHPATAAKGARPRERPRRNDDR